jgi:hypothetical protein
MNATLTIITDGDRQNLIDANGEVVYYLLKEKGCMFFVLYDADGCVVAFSARRGWIHQRMQELCGG